VPLQPTVAVIRTTSGQQPGYLNILTLLSDAVKELRLAGLIQAGDLTSYTPTQQLDTIIGALLRNPSSALYAAVDARSAVGSASLTVAPGNAQVGLTATSTGAATSIRFQRAPTANGPWTDIATPFAGGSASYTDTGLANATQFFYRARAYNARHQAFSTVRAATPIAPLTPMTLMRMRNFIVAIRNDQYPAVLRYRETGRTKVVVRNLDSTDTATANRTVQVGYTTKENQYVQLPSTWIDIPAGSEFVDTSGNIQKMYVKTKTSNTITGEVLVDVYAEVAIP
jgi:hypothetical protein